MFGIPGRGDILLYGGVAVLVVIITAVLTRVFPNLAFTQLFSSIVSLWLLLVSLAFISGAFIGNVLMNKIVGPILYGFIDIGFSLANDIIISPLGSFFTGHSSVAYQLTWHDIDLSPLAEYFANILINITGVNNTSSGQMVLGSILNGSGSSILSNSSTTNAWVFSMSFRNFLFIFLLVFSIYTTILDLLYPQLGIKSFVIQFASWLTATFLLLMSLVISLLGSVGNVFFKPFGFQFPSNFNADLYGTLILQDVISFALIFQLSILELIILIPEVILFIFIVIPLQIIVDSIDDVNLNALWYGNSHSIIFPLTNTKLGFIRIPGLRDIIGLAGESKPAIFQAGVCPVCVTYKPNFNIWHLIENLVQAFTFNNYLATFGVSVTNPGVKFLLSVLSLYGLKF